MIPDLLDDLDIESSKNFLRKVRNDIVGSLENKLEYIKNNQLTLVLNSFLAIKETEDNDIEYLKLNLSVVNSFIATHSNEVKQIVPNYNLLTIKTIKIILSQSQNAYSSPKISFYECCFRLLKTLAQSSVFSVEKFFNTGFISKIDDYLINDVCFQYIAIVLEKICESSYYKHQIIQNENLMTRLIQKFYTNKNISLVRYLLGVLTCLSEEDPNFCRKLCEYGSSSLFLEILSSYIRFDDINIKIFAINLMINVLPNGGEKASSMISKEPLVMWSVSIILNLIKDGGEGAITNHNKIRCMITLSQICKKSTELQDIFYNLEGIDILLKELKSLYTEDKIKEIEDHIKTIKSNKTKKSDRVFLLEKDEEIIQANDTLLDDATEYKRSIFDCLASASSGKEDSRKKIIESKEINLILYSLEDHTSPSKVLLACGNLILSLSRAHMTVKKILNEYDITSILFKLSNNPNVEIQIAITNSLCNFLLDSTNNMSEILECINKLLKILMNTKHSKIRFNSICSIKNIIFYVNSNREIKKAIMKKMTYDYLLGLLDDDDITVQEQALLIFRVLLYKAQEDIEEVFSNCKGKLLAKVYEKLSNAFSNSDIILQSLYILSNISNGNEKQKATIDKNFLKKIIELVVGENKSIRLVCVVILNNLLTSSDNSVEKRLSMMNEFNIMGALEKLVYEEEEESEIKQYAAGMIGQIKNFQNKK